LILCIVLIIFIFYVKFSITKNNSNSDTLTLNTLYKNNRTNKVSHDVKSNKIQSNIPQILSDMQSDIFTQTSSNRQNLSDIQLSTFAQTSSNTPRILPDIQSDIFTQTSSNTQPNTQKILSGIQLSTFTQTSSNIQSNTFTPTQSNIHNLDNSDIIEERIEKFKKIEENDTYPMNTQIRPNANVPYNINTNRTYDYNEKGLLTKIIPEPIPVNNQKKEIKKDYNPRIENFTSVNQLLVKSPLIESNYINQLDFPENTSDELPIFNADTVSQIYNADNITSLYNKINSDIYKGYKTIQFI